MNTDTIVIAVVFAQSIGQMSKKIYDIILASLLLLVLLETGALVGIFLVKNHLYLSSLDIKNIAGIPSVYIVTSGSMQPTIQTGSIVFSSPLKNYKTGDVVTFKNSADSESFITHRIVSVIMGSYTTRGDANSAIDGAQIKPSQIVGKVIIGIPFLGYAANSAKDPKIFILLVIVPATIIVYEELKYLKKESIKRIGFLLKKIKVSEEDNGTNKVSMVIPIFAIFFVLAGVSSSYFTDHDLSLGNSFTAGNWEPTPSEKITICHVAGRKDEPANYITLEIPPQALNGHFDENGTPKAGHEEDYVGPCKSPEPQVAGESVVLPTIEPTVPPTPTPSPTPTETPPQEPTTTPGN